MKTRTPFEKYLERNYKGFNFISIPSQAYVPGIVLNDDDRIIDGISRVFSNEGPEKWTTKAVEANMGDQTINGERGLDLGVTLLGLISLKGGISNKYSVSFEFDQVSEIIFDTERGGVFENDVRRFIMQLKHDDRDRWKELLHEFVVMEVIMVHSVVVEFKRDGKVMLEADLEKLKNELSINGTFTFTGAGKMTIKNDKNLPFGVMGFQVKRFM
jgi:hypothetical protein